MRENHSPEPGFWIAYDMEFNIFANTRGQTRFDGLLELQDEIRNFYNDVYLYARAGIEWGRRVIEVQPPGCGPHKFMLEYVPRSSIKETAERIRAGRVQLGLQNSR